MFPTEPGRNYSPGVKFLYIHVIQVPKRIMNNLDRMKRRLTARVFEDVGSVDPITGEREKRLVNSRRYSIPRRLLNATNRRALRDTGEIQGMRWVAFRGFLREKSERILRDDTPGGSGFDEGKHRAPTEQDLIGG